MIQKSLLVPIALVHPTPVVRAGLRSIIESSPGRFRVVAELSSVEQLIQTHSTREPAPQIIICGETNFNSTALLDLRQARPNVAIIEFGKSEIVDAAHLPVDATARQIIDTLIKTASHLTTEPGMPPLSRQVTKQAELPSDQPLSTLSPREREVFLLIAGGVPNREIAKKLFISPRTVETHRARLIKKLCFNSTADLIKYAVRHELVAE